MNENRRQIGHITIALLMECNHNGLISDESHAAITTALVYLQRQEFHQEKAQAKHEGKNASTDKQLAICRVALPALEEAVAAWNKDYFGTVIKKVQLAITTDGSVPKAKTRRKK